MLTFKCVMLLSLSSIQRVQTLKAIDGTHIRFYTDSAIIPIHAMLKHFRANKNSLSLIINAFSHDPAIYAFSTLKYYVERTSSLRGTNTQLFISFHKPYRAVTCSTLSRYIKSVNLNLESILIYSKLTARRLLLHQLPKLFIFPSVK